MRAQAFLYQHTGRIWQRHFNAMYRTPCAAEGITCCSGWVERGDDYYHNSSSSQTIHVKCVRQWAIEEGEDVDADL